MPSRRSSAALAVAAALAAGAVAAVAADQSTPGGAAGRASPTRAPAAPFRFGSGVAAQLAGLGVIRFKCDADRMLTSVYRHLNTQHATVTGGGRTQRFRHGLVFATLPQPAGRQVWKIVSSTEPVRQTAKVTLTYALTSADRSCYVKRTSIVTSAEPTGG